MKLYLSMLGVEKMTGEDWVFVQGIPYITACFSVGAISTMAGIVNSNVRYSVFGTGVSVVFLTAGMMVDFDSEDAPQQFNDIVFTGAGVAAVGAGVSLCAAVIGASCTLMYDHIKQTYLDRNAKATFAESQKCIFL